MAIKLWNLGQKTEEGAYKELTSVVLDDFNVANFNVGSTIISADKQIEVDPSKAEEQVDKLAERVDAIVGSEADLPIQDWRIQFVNQEGTESSTIVKEIDYELNADWIIDTLGFKSYTGYITTGLFESLNTSYNVIHKTIDLGLNEGYHIKLPIGLLDIMAQYEAKKISKDDFIDAVKDKCLYANVIAIPDGGIGESLITTYENLKLKPISNPVHFYENGFFKYAITYEASVLHGIKVYFTLRIYTWFEDSDNTTMFFVARFENAPVLLTFSQDHFDRYFDPE